MAQILQGKIISPNRIEQGHPDARKRVYPPGRYGATLRNIRIAPNKVRLVVDQIRGEPVERAREILRYSHKKAAYLLDRVLLSALGNADVKSQGRIGAGDLNVAAAYCNESTRLKRFMAGPKGGARPIIRRMSHLTVVLGEINAPSAPLSEPEPVQEEVEAPAEAPETLKQAPGKKAGKKKGARPHKAAPAKKSKPAKKGKGR